MALTEHCVWLQQYVFRIHAVRYIRLQLQGRVVRMQQRSHKQDVAMSVMYRVKLNSVRLSELNNMNAEGALAAR
jgi:hypothetical protein